MICSYDYDYESQLLKKKKYNKPDIFFSLNAGPEVSDICKEGVLSDVLSYFFSHNRRASPTEKWNK